METQKKSGIVAGVNQKHGSYGFTLEEDTNSWYNGKGSADFNKGDQVDFEYTVNGEWKNVQQVYKSEQPKTGYNSNTKIKTFAHLSLDILETQLNEFNEQNKVVATQVYLLPDLYYDAIVYYKQ